MQVSQARREDNRVPHSTSIFPALVNVALIFCQAFCPWTKKAWRGSGSLSCNNTESQNMPTSHTQKILNTPLLRETDLLNLSLSRENFSFLSYMPKYIQAESKQVKGFFSSDHLHTSICPWNCQWKLSSHIYLKIIPNTLNSSFNIWTNSICLSPTFGSEKVQPRLEYQLHDNMQGCGPYLTHEAHSLSSHSVTHCHPIWKPPPVWKETGLMRFQILRRTKIDRKVTF